MTRPGMLIVVLAALTLGGCASGPANYADPVAVMLDRTQGHRKRWAAAEQAERELRSDPKRITALKQMVWERGYPAEWSNYAIDQLIAADEADARSYLSRTIVLIKDWDTLNHLIDTVVARGWTDFVPALVRNYSLRTPVYRDDQRPERAAIAKLRPGVPVEQVVLEVFVGDTDATIQQRVGAWGLLLRLTPGTPGTAGRERVMALLRGLDSDDPLIADLRAGADELGVLPDNLETVAWLRVIRGEAYGEFWREAAAVVAGLSDAQRTGLQLRHLPVLVYLARNNPGAGALSRERRREQIVAALIARLGSQQHHLKGPTYDGPMENHPQVIHAWVDQLAWADLVTIELMMDLMTQPHIVRAWFEQADKDVADNLTEHGGLIRLAVPAGKPQRHRDAEVNAEEQPSGSIQPSLSLSSAQSPRLSASAVIPGAPRAGAGAGARPVAVAYPPMIRKHNWAYYPPQQLVNDAYTALAHYHFHAQEHDNAYYSGPGLGDLERTAATQQFNGLVLTFIDRDRLNVDYYQVGDVVVDLGTVRR